MGNVDCTVLLTYAHLAHPLALYWELIPLLRSINIRSIITVWIFIHFRGVAVTWSAISLSVFSRSRNPFRHCGFRFVFRALSVSGLLKIFVLLLSRLVRASFIHRSRYRYKAHTGTLYIHAHFLEMSTYLWSFFFLRFLEVSAFRTMAAVTTARRIGWRRAHTSSY